MSNEGHTSHGPTRVTLPRRRFLRQTGAGLGALAALAAPVRGRAVGMLGDRRDGGTRRVSQRFFRFAVIADTHIIDDFYKGPEGNALDTETIFKTTARLEKARALINGLSPSVERVFVVGDYFHDYPSQDYDFYFKNRTRIDNAKALTDGFRAPVHVGFGNHDYAVPKITREMSHELFRVKLGLEPYYSVGHRGCKFIHLNNFLGATWDPASADYSRGTGSLGEEQLNWFEAELRERRPTFVFIHYPLVSVRAAEVKDHGILPLLKRYKGNIQLVVSGHWHKWVDMARTFGPQHYVMGATRYDEDAYMIVDVDTKKATHSVANLDFVDWATHYSRPHRRPPGRRAGATEHKPGDRRREADHQSNSDPHAEHVARGSPGAPHPGAAREGFRDVRQEERHARPRAGRALAQHAQPQHHPLSNAVEERAGRDGQSATGLPLFLRLRYAFATAFSMLCPAAGE